MERTYRLVVLQQCEVAVGISFQQSRLLLLYEYIGSRSEY